MHKKAADYVRTHLHKGHSMAEIADKLRKHGWKEEEVEQVLTAAARRHQQKAVLSIALLGFAAFICLGILAYFLIIYPAFVKAPVVEQLQMPNGAYYQQELSASQQEQSPELVSSQAILPGQEPAPTQQEESPDVLTTQPPLPGQKPPEVSAEQVEYVLTKLGAYKLHANPFSGALPEIEIIVADTSQVFDAVVESNKVRVASGNAKMPDARARIDQAAVAYLAAAETDDEFKERANELLAQMKERGYSGELLAKETDLFLKGYLALYKEAKAMASPTGAVASDLGLSDVELMGSQAVGMFVIIVVLWGALILRMALYR